MPRRGGAPPARPQRHPPRTSRIRTPTEQPHPRRDVRATRSAAAPPGHITSTRPNAAPASPSFSAGQTNQNPSALAMLRPSMYSRCAIRYSPSHIPTRTLPHARAPPCSSFNPSGFSSAQQMLLPVPVHAYTVTPHRTTLETTEIAQQWRSRGRLRLCIAWSLVSPRLAAAPSIARQPATGAVLCCAPAGRIVQSPPPTVACACVLAGRRAGGRREKEPGT
jgi:hypothetical protein